LIFVAGLTSVALALSTLVWILPSFAPDQTLINSQKIFNSGNAEIDLSLLNTVKKRLWYVYDSRDKIDKQFYAESVDKYQATMFSSDGWAVAYATDYKKGDEKYWEGVDYQGTVYKIQKVFVDPVSRLTYIKFEGDGFPFISFANWNDIYDNYSAWELSAVEYNQRLVRKDLSAVEPEYKIWEPQLFYSVTGGEAGNILINNSGEMLGILNEDGRVIYGWLINSQYASVLQNGAPDYRGVNWSGYMVNGHVSYGELIKKVSGFYVEKSDTKITSSTVGVGDVIVRVQNQPVNILNLSRQVLLAPENFSVTVYRDGQEFDIQVLKNKVLNN